MLHGHLVKLSIALCLLALVSHPLEAGKELHNAARAGNVKQVKNLLKDRFFSSAADPNELNEVKNTPLHVAAEYGRPKVAEVLLDHEANVNAVNIDGNMPLHLACFRGQGTVASILVAANGTEIDLPNKDGATPLINAAWGGNPEIIKLLLTKGASLESACRVLGNTALHYAIINSRIEASKLLCCNNPFIDLPNKAGLTPLHVAIKKGCFEVAASLITNGANVNAPMNDGSAPLHLVAIKKGYVKATACLIAARGCKYYVKSNGYNLQIPMALVLIDENADIDSQNHRDDTPFNIASNCANIEMLKLLLQYNAQSSIINLKKGIIHLIKQNRGQSTANLDSICSMISLYKRRMAHNQLPQ